MIFFSFREKLNCKTRNILLMIHIDISTVHKNLIFLFENYSVRLKKIRNMSGTQSITFFWVRSIELNALFHCFRSWHLHYHESKFMLSWC